LHCAFNWLLSTKFLRILEYPFTGVYFGSKKFCNTYFDLNYLKRSHYLQNCILQCWQTQTPGARLFSSIWKLNKNVRGLGMSISILLYFQRLVATQVFWNVFPNVFINYILGLSEEIYKIFIAFITRECLLLNLIKCIFLILNLVFVGLITPTKYICLVSWEMSFQNMCNKK